MAELVSAHADAVRTPWSIAYTVSGAAADFDYLASIVVRAVSEPAFDRIEYNRAIRQLQEEVARESETPEPLLRANLLRQLVPDWAPHHGTAASLERLTSADVYHLWARTHRADRLSLVIAGTIPVEAVLAAFQGVGAPSGDPGVPPAIAPPRPSPRPRPQVLRSWYGAAYQAGPSGDPHASVAAVLIGDLLGDGDDGYQLGMELWEIGTQYTLVLTGASYSSRFSAMRTRVRQLISEASERLSPEVVERAAARARLELLRSTADQEGLIRLLGRHLDASDDPGGAAAFLESLQEVDATSMLGYLQSLSQTQPVTAEVRP